MEHKEVKSKIKKYIAKGQTEEAIDLLLEYSEEIDCPAHDEIVLLSGQFMQWKREKLLGIHDTSSELRRIELGIMEIVDKRLGKGKQLQQKQAKIAAATQRVQQSSASPITSTKKERKNNLPVILGAVGLVLVGLIAVWFMSQNKEVTTEPLAEKNTAMELPEVQNAAALTEEESNTSKQQDQDEQKEEAKPVEEAQAPVEEKTIDQKPSTNSSSTNRSTTTAKKSRRNNLRKGESLKQGEAIYSSSGNYRLTLEKNGNLMLFDKDYRAPWTSRTSSGEKLTLKSNGDLVLLDASGNTVWSAGTKNATKLTVENSGKVILLNNSGERIWSSDNLLGK